MEPADNQKSDYSWYNNRELLPILEQERRRRKVAPEEKTPLFPRPYKTNKEDELSRRIKKLLGEWDPKVSLSHECPLNPIWIPRKPKPSSRAPSRRPASSKTNPYEDIWREPSPESLGIRFHPEQNYNDSNEGVSNRRSEAKAPQSKILPELVKKKKPIDVSSTEKTLKVVEKTSSLGPPRVFQSQHKRVAPAQPSNSESGSTKNCHSPSVSAFPRAPAPKPTVDTDVPFIEGILKTKKPSDVPLTGEILKEMSSSLPSLLSHVQTPTRAETSQLPSATKESHPDGSAAQKQKQASTASEALPSSQPRTSVFQSQHKRVAPAQPSNSEPGSTRDGHSPSVWDIDLSSSDSEDSLPRVLDLPARQPGPSTAKKWRLDNLVTQTKQGAVPRESLREIARGNGHEKGVKQKRGISSSSCQQHSKAREPPHKSFGQMATDFHKTFAQGAKDTHKISGQMTKHFHKTSGQVAKAPQKSHVMSTHSSLKPPVHTKEPSRVSKIVGVKRPREPLVHDKSRKVLKLDSKPGPSEVRDHSSKDKLKVQEAENPKPAFRSGLTLGVQKHFEKRKHQDPDKSCARVPKAPDQSWSQVAKTPHESDVRSKHGFLKPPVRTKEALLRNTLDIKRPSMSWVHNQSKRVWKTEREPGLLQATDQSCKDQPKVKKTMKPKATNKEDLKLTLQKLSEKRKDKGSHQANAKGFLEPRLQRHAQECDALIPSGHRPKDLHKGKVPRPPGDKRLFSPAREAGLKRKAMMSPEEFPGKKKREDKGDTPRKKKE
ncbi:AF4/FMR2 family member 1-like [Melospiza melodia melodia]|uniref:AF4/FMR2 family member 1-like n=1 Tax=Melospiza melodia melodia TaxID=1914991 RepID=UPI002FD6615D